VAESQKSQQAKTETEAQGETGAAAPTKNEAAEISAMASLIAGGGKPKEVK